MTHSTPLFSFGTLMDAELLDLVCGQDPTTLQREPAVVHDHIPLWVVDDHYPVLVAHPGARTQGLIIRGLTAQALERIIFFEGGEFTVETIDVVNSGGVLERVEYFADTDRKPVSDHVWRLADWQRLTKADTMPRVMRYMACYGKMGVEEADAFW